MHCTVLFFIVLYCTVLPMVIFTSLQCTVLHCTFKPITIYFDNILFFAIISTFVPICIKEIFKIGNWVFNFVRLIVLSMNKPDKPQNNRFLRIWENNLFDTLTINLSFADQLTINLSFADQLTIFLSFAEPSYYLSICPTRDN